MSVKEFDRGHLDREAAREYFFLRSMQNLADFDEMLRSGQNGDLVFAKMELLPIDRTLCIRLLERFGMALNQGAEAILSLGLRMSEGDRPKMILSDTIAAVPLVVGEIDDGNLNFWLSLPAVMDEGCENRRFIYQVGRRGVDGLLEFVGLGCEGNPTKFTPWENLVHVWEKTIRQQTADILWVEGDRREFVMLEKQTRLVDPITTYFFHIKGAYWGSRPIPFDEAMALGMGKSRRLNPALLPRLTELE